MFLANTELKYRNIFDRLETQGLDKDTCRYVRCAADTADADHFSSQVFTRFNGLMNHKLIGEGIDVAADRDNTCSPYNRVGYAPTRRVRHLDVSSYNASDRCRCRGNEYQLRV